MNKEISPAPIEETLPKYEKLLGEATTGAQALLLLGIDPPKHDALVPTLKKDELVKSATDGIPQDHKKRLTEASYNERDEYWKNTPANERMEKWRQGFNAFLDLYTKDQTQLSEQAFLKTILKVDNLDEVNADRLYNTFMLGEGKGDIEYFARRIVHTHTDKIEQIAKNQELIKNIAAMYGDNSAKITELLTCGIANARHNPDKFIASAQQNLNKKSYGEDLWTPLAENSGKWEKKQMTQTQPPPQPATKPPEQQPQQQPQQPEPSQPEQITPKEFHPLVADADGFTEEDLNKSAPNQDAQFVDRKHGAFGVFDGLGGNIDGEVASSTAREYIEEALGKIPATLPLDQTEQAVRDALVNASNKLWEINEPRYRKLEEQYEKRRAPQPLTNSDLAQINSKSCMSTTAAVVKLWQETEDDGTPKSGGQKKAIISWAGDSRVYLLRAGKLERLTIDDTRLRDLVSPDLAKQIEDKHDADMYNNQEMRKIAVVLNPKETADKDLIDEILRNPKGITIPTDPEAPIEVPYSYFSFAVMTKSLSRNNVEPNVSTIDVQAGDRIILNSDGVNNYTLSSEMADVLNDPINKEAAKAAEALVRLAKKHERVPGGKGGALQDDTTAVVVDIS